ncbi:putative DNA modification/repair radical SAM protein, partial [Salmonella enterica subsp. enterica]
VAKLLREEHDFRGYIHLKTIPEADPALIAEAGRYADRLSVNIELPTDKSLQTLAPEKQIVSIKQAMQTIYTGEQTVLNEPRAPRFAP